MRELWIGLILALLLSANASAQFFAAEQDWISSWVLNGQTEEQFENQLELDYQMRVKMIDRLCELDADQRSKLTSAADADVSRFFRDVAKTRREIKSLDLEGNRNQDVNKVWAVVSPLQVRINEGLFENKSLFQRVMRSVLSGEQQELYQSELKRNQKRKWKAITRVNLAEIERSMPLLADQREKMLQILDVQELPKTMTKHMDGYAGFLKLVKAQKTDKKAFAEFLDEKQLKVIDQYCDRYQGWVGN